MRSLWNLFLRSRDGSVAIIAALAIIPMTLLIGAGVDYGMAADRQAQLEGYADAAALSAVTPTMMTENNSQAQAVAQNSFNAQASTLTQVTYNTSDVTATVTTTPGNVRTATVSYSVPYNTFFASILGMSTITLKGGSTATGGLPPNIDFYLLLDDSPSMAIAATTSGINTMITNTQGQCDSAPYGGSSCGCAFACHEQAPNGTGENHYIPTGTGSPLCTASNNYKYCQLSGLGNSNNGDNFSLARSLGVTLRIDLLNQAAQNLMATAQSMESGNNAHYRAAIYTFDYQVNTLQALTSNLSTAESSAANLALLEVYSNNYLTSSNDNNDTDTDFQTALKSTNTAMPNPGSGTNNVGDTPQEILFIVTDGVDDAQIASPASPPSATAASYGNLSSGGSPWRLQATINPQNNGGSEVLTPDYCAKIKGRGIRIAILYTEYLPIPNNGWYNSHVSPFQTNVGPQLQGCASPNLYSVVTTDGDISAALQQLFNAAVESAYLVK
ncbi:MAG TPA: pilus assembly protein TadG-related protein [Rhizomicrobium sp.]|jgi:Flp pilus assembly protein TadG|nr:pilus assembly protein TadG-related protein [Rhizomicrobium sp.]